MNPPRLLKDLYGDLRDRRLLPVIIVLIAATATVPIVLGSDTDRIASSPPDPSAEAESMPMVPAVLASDPSLRDYHERLDSLSSKNPFADDSPASDDTATEESVGEVATEGATETAVSSGGASTSFSETFDETVSESSSSTETSTGDDVTVEIDESGGGDGGTGGSGGSGDGSEPGEGGWYAYTVDVRTGLAGDLRERNNLQGLTVLPSRSNPVAIFMGVSDAGKEAVFMVSPDVIDSRGDGSCLPSPAACQFLSLRKDEERRFEYAPHADSETYVLAIDEITLERLKKPPQVDRAAKDDGVGSGLRSFLGS